jgi:hypothetical protein
MDILSPYLPRILPIFDAALSLHNEDVSAKARADYDDRAAASAVYCHTWKGFEREFSEEPGFHFLIVRGLKLLNVRDAVVLRAKKVDENGRHRNSDTEQQRAFDAQEQLPGLPASAARVVIGYQPDIAFSEVERVTVRQPLFGWVSQVIETDGAFSWIDITPAQLQFGKSRRSTG